MTPEPPCPPGIPPRAWAAVLAVKYVAATLAVLACAAAYVAMIRAG